MTFFVYTNGDWQHAEEFSSESEARAVYDEAIGDGYESTKSAAVYAAPNRSIFEAHMGKACRLVVAGIPRDHPFLSDVRAEA